jgi:surfactin synthase thioesterase subunit
MTLARLIFVPDAGGSPSHLQPIPFSPDVDVMAVQYPRRGVDVDRLTMEVLALGEKPTVFLGHDRGAWLAFETVRRLEETTTGPYGLILLTDDPCPPGHRLRARITVITGEYSVNEVNDEIDRMILWLTTPRALSDDVLSGGMALHAPTGTTSL